MNKKLKNLIIFGAFGISSALGLGYIAYRYPHKAEAQEKNFYEKKEQINAASFRYFLDNGITINVTYDWKGNFCTQPFGGDQERLEISYNKKENTLICERWDHFKITDKNDDGSVEQIIDSFDTWKSFPRDKYPELYQKAETLLKKLKEMIKYDQLKKEAENIKALDIYKNKYNNFVDFAKTFNKINKK